MGAVGELEAPAPRLWQPLDTAHVLAGVASNLPQGLLTSLPTAQSNMLVFQQKIVSPAKREGKTLSEETTLSSEAGSNTTQMFEGVSLGHEQRRGVCRPFLPAGPQVGPCGRHCSPHPWSVGSSAEGELGQWAVEGVAGLLRAAREGTAWLSLAWVQGSECYRPGQPGEDSEGPCHRPIPAASAGSLYQEVVA